MKSSIWRYVVNVKSTVKILSIFVAFLENMNFTNYKYFLICDKRKKRSVRNRRALKFLSQSLSFISGEPIGFCYYNVLKKPHLAL